MNWTKASAIAEVLSSVAIVATLVYLAVQTQHVGEQTEILAEQTRQNTVALISASRQQTLASELVLLRMGMDFPETGRFDERSPGDSRRVQMSLAIIRTREHMWHQVQDGQLDATTFQSYIPVLIAALASEEPIMQQVWAGVSPLLNRGFVADVESELSDALAQNE